MTLDALFERAKEFAQLAFKIQGTVHPMWLFETSDGRHLPITLPAEAMQDKDLIAAKIKELMQKEQAVRYASILESWVVTVKSKEEISEALPVRNHPNRKECIFVIAEDKFHSHTGMFYIEREGNKATLSEFEDCGKGELDGRFQGLLTDTPTIQ